MNRLISCLTAAVLTLGVGQTDNVYAISSAEFSQPSSLDELQVWNALDEKVSAEQIKHEGLFKRASEAQNKNTVSSTQENAEVKSTELKKPKIQQAFGQQSIHFEPNLGQTADEVKYTARGPGYTLFLTNTEAVFSLEAPRKAEDTTADLNKIPDPMVRLEQAQDIARPEVLRMQLLGKTFNPKAKIKGQEKRKSYSNYYYGNDKDNWQANVPHYGKVEYEDVYPGIDLVYYGNPQQLEYDFVVAPGADPNQIQLAFEGADNINIADNGNLNLTINDRKVAFKAPVIYQVKDGKREAIAGHYNIEKNQLKLAGKTTTETKVGFQLAAYDSSLPLVIDPVLEYSTYLGGSSLERGLGIAVDDSGNTYIAGVTESSNFPAFRANYENLSGERDAFVTCLDSAGQLVYSSYLGGSIANAASGITVDSRGNAFVVGNTYSTDFPTINASQENSAGGVDAFVTELSSSGQVVYSTYLGGSSNDFGRDIAVDASSNIYVTGTTDSNDFSTTNAFQVNYAGGQDAFITKFDSSRQRLYSTYLGGDGYELGNGIAVDISGNAYVTGRTDSANFPTFNAYQGSNPGGPVDAFVTQLNSGGQVVFSTYLGGSYSDMGRDIVVDNSGNAFITGTTKSSDFPTDNLIQTGCTTCYDIFVTQFSNSGEWVNSTRLGGSGVDSANSIALDSNGNTFVTGYTTSTDLPTVNTYQANYGGGQDAFIAQFNSSGQWVYSTYLGGSGRESGNDIAVDANGNTYIAGDTYSNDFPVANALQGSYLGSGDVFITKFSQTTNLPPIANPKTITVNENFGVVIVLTATDPDGDTLNYSITSQPANGRLLGTAPYITYSPDVNFSGADSFTFKVNDGIYDSNIATVNININSLNEAPVADFTVDFVTGVAPYVMKFDASLSSDVDGNIVSYRWDTCSGIGYGSPIVMQYDRRGNCFVKLTVTDDQGAITTKESLLYVRTLYSYTKNPWPNQTVVIPVTISGSATSMVGVENILIEIQDNASELWWTGTGWGERIQQSASITNVVEDITDWQYIFNPAGTNGSGNYRVLTTAIDVNGDQQSGASESFFSTTDNPNLLLEATIISPASDELLTLPVLLQGTATAPNELDSVLVGINDERRDKWWNGESWGEWQLNPVSPTAVNNNLHDWEYNFDPTGSGGSGVYRAYVRAKDITGAISRSVMVPFKAFGDTIIPFESIINTPELDEVIILPYNITGTASAPEGVRDVLIGIKDNASGLWWTGSGWGDWVLHSTSIDQFGMTSVNWQYGFDPSGTNGSGNYRIHTRAVEVRGLREPESTQLNFTGLDSGNLTLDTFIDIPSRNQILPLPATLTGSATSPTGIDSVMVGIRDTVNDLWWNGSTWSDWQLNPTPVTPVNGKLVNWNYDFNPTTSGGSGQYRAYIRARDIDGVLAESTQVQFKAYETSGVGFESIINFPSANQAINLPSTIDGTATAPSGVSNVLLGIRDEVSKLWWNGSSWGEWILMPTNTVQVDSTSASWSYDFDPMDSNHSGRFRIYTRAVDMSSIRSESAQVSFTVVP